MILGIDPGEMGSFGFRFKSGKVVSYSMPGTDFEINQFLNETIEAYLDHGEEKYAFLEKVHAMPKQGVTSSFNFGGSYRAMKMLLVCNRIPFELVTPQAWQKNLQIPKRDKSKETPRDFKKRLMGIAMQLYPDQFVGLKTIESKLSISDSLLILEHGIRKKGIKLPF